jgi:hypothetical protein
MDFARSHDLAIPSPRTPFPPPRPLLAPSSHTTGHISRRLSQSPLITTFFTPPSLLTFELHHGYGPRPAEHTAFEL